MRAKPSFTHQSACFATAVRPCGRSQRDESTRHPWLRSILGLLMVGLGPWFCSAQAGELDVTFRDGSFGVLERFLGPNDNPRDQKPDHTVVVESGHAVHLVPAAAPGPRLTGFLEPPARFKPMPSDITIEWTLPDVRELHALAANGGVALAGHYIRGEDGVLVIRNKM